VEKPLTRPVNPKEGEDAGKAKHFSLKFKVGQVSG
jgi:hypothetical protein